MKWWKNKSIHHDEFYAYMDNYDELTIMYIYVYI